MKRILVSLFTIAFLGVGFLASAQDKGGTNDRIKIVSISAENPVRDGVANDFTVQLEYTLDSADEGVVSIGFNVDKDDPGRYRMITMKKVGRGTSAITLKAKVSPKDWKERGDFFMNAILRPATGDSKSRSLAGTSKVIQFEP